MYFLGKKRGGEALASGVGANGEEFSQDFTHRIGFQGDLPVAFTTNCALNRPLVRGC